ncbi:LacI family DNA-binding transcriptional regulator, partial [Mycobacterium tuberculosis]|uniref:LacI family DNA-binding transcriptional regulator n=1 Tax=Mycobacterium tuberculosis TaxID=1773 RepID=UPI0039BCAF99
MPSASKVPVQTSPWQPMFMSAPPAGVRHHRRPDLARYKSGVRVTLRRRPPRCQGFSWHVTTPPLLWPHPAARAPPAHRRRRPMPASVKDVAALAGVSASTVSNYLNH